MKNNIFFGSAPGPRLSACAPGPRFFTFIASAALAGWMITAMPAAQAQVSVPDFQALSEALLPTVVNVSTTTKIDDAARPPLPQIPELPPGSPFEDFFKDFYDQYQNQGPQREEKVSALGSGFVIDAAGGYIVTNNHVIKDADEIKIILHDDTSLDATLVGTDEKTDLAVLKVKTDKPLMAAHWGDSDLSKVGSWVLAIGNPFGLGGTVTAGIVSARQRNINAGPYDEFIQTDASINRGNSGGPMFNTKGEVIGVNTAIFSPSGGSVGIGFAVPSNLAKGIVEQLIKYGKTKRGWLGVHIQEVTPEIAESMGLDKPKGALVSGVTSKSPAAAAGIVAGDIILTFDGKEISQMRHLPRMVAESEVGKKASLTLFRKGEKKEVTVDLGQLEKAEEDGVIKSADSSGRGKPAATEQADVGISLSALNDSLRDTYDIAPATTGVLVTDVKKDGPAADKGMREGDVIVQVDQKDVTTPKDVDDLVSDAKKTGRGTVLFFVSRKEDMRFIAVKLKK
jgi:serine protease Do